MTTPPPPPPSPSPPPNAVSHQSAATTLAAQLVNVDLVRQGRTLLNGVNLNLKAGHCTVLLGPNGCGKTTLTRLLTGFLYPTRGQVTVLGQQLGQTDVRALRQRIGVINPASTSQAVPVVTADLTAQQAVLTGLFGTAGLHPSDQATITDQQIQKAIHLLQTVGLNDHLNQPFGTLSTGEQRRVLIARALIDQSQANESPAHQPQTHQPQTHQPKLLILDEPTAGLDLRGREQILATIDQILQTHQPPTVLLITHHVEEISPRTDQVYLMKQGQILFEGPPEQALTPEKLSETFGCKVYVRQEDGRWWLQVLPEAWLDLI